MRRSPTFNHSPLLSPHAPKSTLQHFASFFPSRSEVNPPTLRCCSPLTPRSQPSTLSLLFSLPGLNPAFNTSLPFSPHAPKSTLQHFAAVLPSRAEVNPTTLRCCPPLTRRTQPSISSLLPNPLGPESNR